MNYNHLRYFSVLAELEHYTQAAARLGITQPSLSSAIRQLEDELGVCLFEKVGRNIRLTEQGRFFQRKVSEALEEIRFATNILRSGGAGAPIPMRLGIVSGALAGNAAAELLRCLKQEPRDVFEITEDSSPHLLDLLRQERLDMAIVSESLRDRSLHFRRLCRKPLYAAVPEDHPLALLPSVSPDMLQTYPQIALEYSLENEYDAWADGPQQQVPIHFLANTRQTALDLVAAGGGITVTTIEDGYRCPGVAFVPLENRYQALYLCTLYDKWLEPPIWDVVERLVAVFRQKDPHAAI